MATPVRAHSLSLAHQAYGLRSLFPGSQISIRGRTLIWAGSLRPSELSEQYRVRITYRVGRYPTVRVIDPPITETDQFVPHVYDTGDLCVHDDHDWKPSMLLVDTVIAWTVEWLLFWELFLSTGTWFGDGPKDNSAPQPPAEQLPPLSERK